MYSFCGIFFLYEDYLTKYGDHIIPACAVLFVDAR